MMGMRLADGSVDEVLYSKFNKKNGQRWKSSCAHMAQLVDQHSKPLAATRDDAESVVSSALTWPQLGLGRDMVLTKLTSMPGMSLFGGDRQRWSTAKTA